MQLFHTHRSLSASFDDPNLVPAAGLVSMTMMTLLAAKTGLGALIDEWVKLPGYYRSCERSRSTASSPRDSLDAEMRAGDDDG